MFRRFTFAEDHTHLAQSLLSASEVCAKAKVSMAARAQGREVTKKILLVTCGSYCAAAQALQLVFVISDAKIDTDNRERLGRVVREMREQNILCVCIVIDRTADAKDSIFNTQVVQYTPTGIQMRSYFHRCET
jgi:hypothetical protein